MQTDREQTNSLSFLSLLLTLILLQDSKTQELLKEMFLAFLVPITESSLEELEQMRVSNSAKEAKTTPT